MSTASNDVTAPHEALATHDRSPRSAAFKGPKLGERSRIRRRDAYLVALLAGIAAIAVCVASYMVDARRHSLEPGAPTGLAE